MIGSLWQMDCGKNGWLWVVLKQSSPSTWQLLNLIDRSVEHGWLERDGKFKLITHGPKGTLLHRYEP